MIGLTGCYHATVTTGLEPSAKQIEEPFALSFVYGLIPPSTVNAESQCTNGVAQVETKLSFVNSLVRGLTAGLFTPMSIEVTCASSSAALDVDKSDLDHYVLMDRDDDGDMTTEIQKAAEKSVASNQPVLITSN
jgi:hypothetical protein